jgi:hypothetical protein
VNEIGHGLRIEAEALFGDRRDEAGTGFEIGIVEFAIALILLEVRCVRGREECALVMIEPPSDFGRAGILEVHNGVFIAIEMILVKQSPGAVQQAGEHELHVAADPFAVETGEKRCR